jgi:hypothetical protein
MGKSILVFDIDGTLAKKEDFGSMDLVSIPAKDNIVRIAKAAQRPDMGRMAIVTARPESSRKGTEAWVKKHGLKPEFLLMRGEGDSRPDFEVRVDQVRSLMKRMGNNIILYDDKQSNCEAVRKALGITCNHIKN